MPIRAYLVKLTNVSGIEALDGTWHPTIHDQVIAQGGSWEIKASWDDQPNADPIRTKDYHALAVVDVTNHGILTDCHDLNIVCTDMADAISKIKLQSIDLPSQAQTALQNAGFTVSSNLYDTIKSVIDHGNPN